MNGLIQWMLDQISGLMNWENVRGRLQPVTLADDIEKKQIQLQLAAGQQISRQTAYAPLGINFREEVKRMFEEEQWYQETSARFQEEQAQKQELQQQMSQGVAANQQQMMAPPGMMPPGGDPAAMAAGGGMPPGAAGAPPAGDPAAAGGAMPTGGGSPADAAIQQLQGGQVTPEDMMAQAEQIAYQMLGMPYELRRSELLKIKKANETLHALVIAQMQKVRQSAKSQGGFQALQQQVGAGMM
jgi:hypothetical protein